MRYPNIWKAGKLVDYCLRVGVSESRDGDTWTPARPLGMQTIRNRVHAAWLVFTGRADAVLWDFSAPRVAQPDRRFLHDRGEG